MARALHRARICVIIEGRVRIESVTAKNTSCAAGDACRRTRGLRGYLEVTEPCKKWYSIFEVKRI